MDQNSNAKIGFYSIKKSDEKTDSRNSFDSYSVECLIFILWSRMIESIVNRWKTRKMKKRVIFYRSSHKNEQNWKQLLDPSRASKIKRRKQSRKQSWTAEKYNTQSDSHTLSKSNDCRATDHNSLTEWESSERWCERSTAWSSHK